MPKIKLRKIRGFWGEYDPNVDQIWLDIRLQKKTRPSKKSVYYHEEYHKYLMDRGINTLNDSIELKCEVYSLMRCRRSELTYLERFLKKAIMKKFGKLSKAKILKMEKFI